MNSELNRRSILKFAAAFPFVTRGGLFSFALATAEQAFANQKMSPQEFVGLSARLLAADSKDLNQELGARYLISISSSPQEQLRLRELRKAVLDIENNIVSENQIPEDLRGSAKQIVQLWYSGVITDGHGKSRLVYDDALMFKFFYRERPAPVICAGAFGSWSQKPEKES